MARTLARAALSWYRGFVLGIVTAKQKRGPHDASPSPQRKDAQLGAVYL